jgi:hypothetical protein
MEEMGYKIETKTETGAPRQHPIVIPYGRKNHYRLDKLGEFYELDSIKQRIQNNYREKESLSRSGGRQESALLSLQGKSAESNRSLRPLSLLLLRASYHRLQAGICKKGVGIFLREDVTKLDQYIAQADFLGKQVFTTTEELAIVQIRKGSSDIKRWTMNARDSK